MKERAQYLSRILKWDLIRSCEFDPKCVWKTAINVLFITIYVLLNYLLVCIRVIVKIKLPKILSEVVLQTKKTKHFFIILTFSSKFSMTVQTDCTVNCFQYIAKEQTQ